jgi:hypothetical protein
MTKLRPGLGSYTANWGTHDDRVFETFLWGTNPFVSLRHLSDPTHGWIGPQAGDRGSTIEPEGVRPRWQQHRLDQRGKDCCGPTTE